MTGDFLASGIDLHQAAGLAGFSVYVTNYLLLSLAVLDSRASAYFGLNILAASLVLVSLSADFNLASALIQSFWIVIGATAIGLRLAWGYRRGRGGR